MLYPAPTAIPDPQLAQAPVHTLLAHFATALPWLTDAYGLVQTGVDKNKNKAPQLYLQNGGLLHVDVLPDEKMGALSFFEYDGPAEFEWADPLHLSGYVTHPLALVVWANLPLVDPNRGYDFSAELATDMLTRGLLGSPLGADLTPGSIEQRAERVFQRYQFPPERQQLLMYPFAGFRVPFTVRAKYAACQQPFTPAAGGPFLLASDGAYLLAHTK